MINLTIGLSMSSSFSLESGKRIPVGGEDRRGPLATYGVVSQPLGTAVLSHGVESDLFVRTTKFGQMTGLFLYPFSERTESGVPVFKKGIRIEYPFEGGFPPPGEILQIDNGDVHGFWLVENAIVHTEFNTDVKSFEEKGRLTIEGLPRPARNLTLYRKDDGNWSVVFEVSDGSSYRPPGPGSRDPEYNPYDGRGIWRGDLTYAGLYGAEMKSDFSALTGPATLVSSSTREVLDTFFHLASGPLTEDSPVRVVGGSRMGEISTYVLREGDTGSLEKKRFIVGRDGNALRHPTILPAPVLYRNPQSGCFDLLAGGEGGIYYYPFTGQIAEAGSPIFLDPVPALQEDADLYAGSLPVPNLVDWDGDGDLDIVSGNSEGLVLFLENIGSNDTPSFSNGVPLEAGGERIHVQPGYRLDIQGPFESRWGYTCPTVADWNGDGLPDILMSDSTARHQVYLNIGTPTEPRLAMGRPLYLDGLDLHGMWRVKPGVGEMGRRMAYVALDDDDEFHLYWRVDDYHVEEGGKLRLEDGSPIGANFLSAGGTGRVKINLVDWDLDGELDLLLGTPKHGSVPDPIKGLPQSLGLPGAAVLFLKNVGTGESPRFKFPVILRFGEENLFIGHHACGPTAASFKKGTGPDLVVGNEDGRFLFYSREDLSWE